VAVEPPDRGSEGLHANGLSLDEAPISTGQLYPWVQPGAPANPPFGLAAGNPVNPDGAYEGNYNGFGTLNDRMVGPMNSLFSSSV
jgi:hypothetical protein